MHKRSPVAPASLPFPLTTELKESSDLVPSPNVPAASSLDTTLSSAPTTLSVAGVLAPTTLGHTPAPPRPDLSVVVPALTLLQSVLTANIPIRLTLSLAQPIHVVILEIWI